MKLNCLVENHFNNDSEKFSKDHRSLTSIYDIFHSLKEVEEKILMETISKTNYVGISIDDSDDISNIKNLVIYCQYLDKDRFILKNSFLDLINLKNFDSKSIFQETKKSIMKLGLYEKLISFNSDNAKVVSSCENGVARNILKEIPYLYHFTCCAHSLNLVSSDLNNTFGIIEKIFHTIYNIHSYFRDSKSVLNY